MPQYYQLFITLDTCVQLVCNISASSPHVCNISANSPLMVTQIGLSFAQDFFLLVKGGYVFSSAGLVVCLIVCLLAT